VIDLGPETGRNGGELIAAGTPEEIAACKSSHTGRFLGEAMGQSREQIRIISAKRSPA
jgi:excinuclease ABC subunit A